MAGDMGLRRPEGTTFGKSACRGTNGPEPDRNPRIPDAGCAGRCRPDEDGGRRHLRHRRQALRAPAERQAHHHGPREHRLHRQGRREFTRRKGFKEGDLVFVEHYVRCGKCEWCHAGQYRHCENTNWRTNPDAIRYGYTSAEKAPHLWGGFAAIRLPAVELGRAPCAEGRDAGACRAGDADGERRRVVAVRWRRRLQFDGADPGAGPAGPLADRDLPAGRALR